jgi:hypothetical protein
MLLGQVGLLWDKLEPHFIKIVAWSALLLDKISKVEAGEQQSKIHNQEETKGSDDEIEEILDGSRPVPSTGIPNSEVT